MDDGLFKWLNIGKTAAAAVFTLTGSDQEPVFLLRKEKFFQLKNGTRAELSRSHSELAKGLLTNNSQWHAYFSGGSLEVIIPIKDDGQNKCTDLSRLWRKPRRRKFGTRNARLPCAARKSVLRAQICASRHCREIPAPLLKGGEKAQRRQSLAHTDRKIQVGRGAVARKNAIIGIFMYTFFVIRPSRRSVRMPGFFSKKMKKVS